MTKYMKEIIELCDEIEREGYDIGCYIKTGAIYDGIQVILSRIKDIRSAVGRQSEPHRAYWIPTECGVKCSSCDTEYADSDYLYMMYQCPHCFAEMGETRKSPKTNGDKIRAMTDEELAKMVSMEVCRILKPDGKDCPKGFYFGKCDKCVISWLKQEVNQNE